MQQPSSPASGPVSGPLSGVRVIDLSAVVSGPMAAGMLADQGAEVIKVEARGGDLTRRIGPAKGDLTPMFVTINRGKRSIVLDLKQDSARQVLHQLIAGADVLIENFRPGAMARLGFGYEAVSAWHPGLVYLSISGFGDSGPLAGARVYDPVIQAVSGLAAAHPDPATGEPRLLQTLVCDKLTSLTAAQAVTAALFERSRTGRGQQVKLSMLDAALAFSWPEAMFNHSWLDDAPPPILEFGANQRLWRAQDGWFAMITPQDEEFAAMARVFGLPGLLSDPRFATILSRRDHQPELRALLEPVAAQQPVTPFVARLIAAGVPAGRVNLKPTLHEDEQVRHNASLLELDHGAQGRVRSAGPAARFGNHGPAAPAAAPHLGQHSREVLAGLGLEAEAISALFASGAVS